MISLFQRLPANEPTPSGMALARCAAVENDRVVFWLVKDKRHVEMPLGERSRGEFRCGSFYAVVVSEEREVVA